jgi:hypothetical protein
MNELWLGYDSVSIPFEQVAAVLIYQRAFDRQILLTHGVLPPVINAVVVTADGRYLPSRWRADQLRQRLSGWRARVAS